MYFIKLLSCYNYLFLSTRKLLKFKNIIQFIIFNLVIINCPRSFFFFKHRIEKVNTNEFCVSSRRIRFRQ